MLIYRADYRCQCIAEARKKRRLPLTCPRHPGIAGALSKRRWTAPQGLVDLVTHAARESERRGDTIPVDGIVITRAMAEQFLAEDGDVVLGVTVHVR